MARRKKSPVLIYQMKVTLEGIAPPVWRRFQVPDSLTLAQLHDALQIIMGWTDSHLHRFILNSREYGRPDYEERFDDDTPLWDERRVRLSDLFTVVPAAFLYEYDYGDGWLHVIVVELILSPTQGVHYPRCEAGERACPPEDVGGVSGYEEMLAVLADPEHEEYEMMRTWAGEDYDPAAFDLESVNHFLVQPELRFEDWEAG